MSLGSNGVDRVRSLRKILTRLRGTNFCIRSACFPSRFASQPNGPKCIKIVWNMPKHEFRVQWGGLGAFVAKIPKWLRDTNFCTSLPSFASSFLRQPNGPKCTQIVWNTQKHEFRVQWGGSGAFVVKSYNTTLWHELSHQFCPFSIKFCEPTRQYQLH